MATGKVPVTPDDNGKPVALVNIPEAGVPNAGEVNVGLVNVLLVKVSVPPKVAKVPEVGKVTEVAAVVVNVVANAPNVVKLPANETLLPPILPTVVAPVFDIVTSPDMATAAAKSEALPTSIFDDANEEPDAGKVIFAVPSNETPLIVLAVCSLVADPAFPVILPEIALVTVKLAKVPTEVNDELRTVGFKIVPVNVPAAAVTVISVAPSKAVPLIFLEVANLVAVAEFPPIFKFATGVVEVTENGAVPVAILETI